jgi:hypothetical protein
MSSRARMGKRVEGYTMTFMVLLSKASQIGFTASPSYCYNVIYCLLDVHYFEPKQESKCQGNIGCVGVLIGKAMVCAWNPTTAVSDLVLRANRGRKRKTLTALAFRCFSASIWFVIECGRRFDS